MTIALCAVLQQDGQTDRLPVPGDGAPSLGKALPVSSPALPGVRHRTLMGEQPRSASAARRLRWGTRTVPGRVNIPCACRDERPQRSLLAATQGCGLSGQAASSPNTATLR